MLHSLFFIFFLLVVLVIHLFVLIVSGRIIMLVFIDSRDFYLHANLIIASLNIRLDSRICVNR